LAAWDFLWRRHWPT